MDKKSSPAYTMSSKFKQMSFVLTPGPLSYNAAEKINLIKKCSPAAT